MDPSDKADEKKSFIFPSKNAGQSPFLRGSVFRAGIIGLHPVAGAFVGGGAGYFLWKKFDAPWCFWFLLLIGFMGGCLNAYRDLRAMMREEEAGNAGKNSSRR